MEDQLVTFKTAKLAKEKGFNLKVRYSYGHAINSHIAYPNEDFAVSCDFNSPNIGRNWEHLDSAPTQSLLQRWLREKHDIIVTVTSYNDDELQQVLWENEIENIKDDWNIFSDYTFHHTYEEALEAGLQEGLKLIKL